MDENSEKGQTGPFGKYLKYALGEILLVVIGIFIALQVNIVVEKNKEHKRVVGLLQGVSEDLKKDQERMDFLHDFYKEKSHLMGFMLNSDINSQLTTNDSLASMFSKSLYFRRFSSKKSNYISLVSEGLLNSIQDKKLIDELITYYDSPYLTWSTEIYGDIILSLNFQEAEFYDLRDRLNSDASLGNVPELNYLTSATYSDYDKVLQSRWARNLFSSALLQANTIFGNLETFGQMNSNLQESIGNYK